MWTMRRLSRAERARQPEPAQDAVVEPDQGADPVTSQSEHGKADAGPVTGTGTKVGPERRLAVGSRRDEVEPSSRPEDAVEQASGDLPALVLKRHRWHGNE